LRIVYRSVKRNQQVRQLSQLCFSKQTHCFFDPA